MSRHQNPIIGQRWYEKLLDGITQGESFRWSIVGIIGYAVLLVFGVYLLANVMNQPDMADVLIKLWCPLFSVAAILAMINPLSSFWEIRAERKLQKLIKEYIGEHSRCTYDELVTRCMPLKIHLGMDPAIENMLPCRELVEEECGSFRLPNA